MRDELFPFSVFEVDSEIPVGESELFLGDGVATPFGEVGVEVGGVITFFAEVTGKGKVFFVVFEARGGVDEAAFGGEPTVEVPILGGEKIFVVAADVEEIAAADAADGVNRGGVVETAFEVADADPEAAAFDALGDECARDAVAHGVGTGAERVGGERHVGVEEEEEVGVGLGGAEVALGGTFGAELVDGDAERFGDEFGFIGGEIVHDEDGDAVGGILLRFDGLDAGGKETRGVARWDDDADGRRFHVGRSFSQCRRAVNSDDACQVCGYR